MKTTIGNIYTGQAVVVLKNGKTAKGEIKPVVVTYWPMGMDNCPDAIWCNSNDAAQAAYVRQVAFVTSQIAS